MKFVKRRREILTRILFQFYSRKFESKIFLPESFLLQDKNDRALEVKYFFIWKILLIKVTLKGRHRNFKRWFRLLIPLVERRLLFQICNALFAEQFEKFRGEEIFHFLFLSFYLVQRIALTIPLWSRGSSRLWWRKG